MPDLVELKEGKQPEGDFWVLVHVTEKDVIGSEGDVILRAGGITFKTRPGEPQESLNIAHAETEAEDRGLPRFYIQRDASNA